MSPLQPHPLDSDIEVFSTTITPKIKAEQPPRDEAQAQSCANSKKRQFLESWTSCREDESFGFLLDMRGDTREWPLGSDGKKLSMVAKIKQEDTDSWGKDLVVRDSCLGSYICEQFDMELLDSVKRYEPDREQRKRFFEAERAQNELDVTSPAVHAALFYQEMLSTACSLAGCTGVAALRLMKQIPDIYLNLIEELQRFKSIPSNINEVLIKELFQNSGTYSQATENKKCLPAANIWVKIPTANVGRIDFRHAVHSRRRYFFPLATKLKHYHWSFHGRENDPRAAVSISPQISAKIAIHSLLNHDDYGAIVIVTCAHNHPMFPARKLSSGSKGAKAYKDAAARIGAVGLTVTKLFLYSQALANQNIDVSDLDPALINPHLRQNLLKDVKIEQNGGLETDIEGIHVLIEKEAGLPLDERYIHQFLNELDEDGSHTELIITMVPRLAEQFHCVMTRLHDNTCKRIADKKWKEWEVVAWSNRLNMCEILARVFMSRETRKTFYLAFSGLCKTVKTLSGREV
ncbi:hypothetical protein C8J56DRAFT_896427 [Mycena floridula]|nr:hypothetical protein C8J56DRAFT_896427 [Mycena floridula]